MAFAPGAGLLISPRSTHLQRVEGGKVGGYTDYVTAEQAARMGELVEARLSPVFGYVRADSALDRAASL